MTFFWLLVDASGGPSGRSEEFASRGAAEGWLSERWQDLRASGTAEVALHRGDAEVYRMSLSEE